MTSPAASSARTPRRRPSTRRRPTSASIATLGFLIIVNSLIVGAQGFTRGSQAMYGVPKLVGLPLAIALAAAAIVIARLYRDSAAGVRLRAGRDNDAAARACGIPIERLKLQVYGIAGLLFGLAGVMQMSRLRQGDPTVAAGTELDVIAAVVIGGGSLSGGEGTILGSMIGALVMAFLRNGSQQMGWPSYVQEILIGVIIVVAVAIDRWRHAQQGESE